MASTPNIPPPPSGSLVLSNVPPPPSGVAVATQPNSTQPATSTPPANNEWDESNPDMYQQVGKFGTDVLSGAGAGVFKTAFGLDNLIRKGLNHLGGNYKEIDERDFGMPKGSLTETHGAGEKIGEFGENIIEFFTGEEILGMLGKMGKGAVGMKNAAQVSAFLDKYPRIAKLLHIGVNATRNAAISGGQTLVKTGGDVDEAKQAAAIGGIASAAIEGGAGAVKAGINRIRPHVENVGGVKVPAPAAVRQATPTATQAASQEVYRSTAQEAARPAIEGIENARNGVTRNFTLGPLEQTPHGLEHPILNAKGEEIGVINFRKSGGAAEINWIGDRAQTSELSKQLGRNGIKELQEQFVAEHPDVTSIGGIRIGGVRGEEARSVHHEIAAQNARREAGSMAATVPESVMPQVKAPINQVGSMAATVPESVLGPKSAASSRDVIGDMARERAVKTANETVATHLDRVHDFTGAADLVQEQAQAIYNRADQLSGGVFRTANDELRQAQNAAWRARGTERATEAGETLRDKMKAMEAVLDGLKGKMNPQELTAARTSFRRYYTLRDIGNTLDSAWSGTPGSSARANAYRGFDGNRLMSGLQRLTRDMGRKEVEGLLGKGRLENLERIAELNRTGANRQKFGAAINHVSEWIAKNRESAGRLSTIGASSLVARTMGVPWEYGAIAGEVSYEIAKGVMRAVATNPKLGQYLTYAIEYGAKPEHYAPMLGAMIQANVETPERSTKGEDK